MIQPERNVWPGLATGLVISLLAHGVVAWWLVDAANANPSQDIGEDPSMPMPPPPPPDPLGKIDANQASIAWLGVQSNPTEGRAPESEVDQAALSPLPGLESVANPPPMPQKVDESPEISEPAQPEMQQEPQPESQQAPESEPITEPAPVLPAEPTPQKPVEETSPPAQEPIELPPIGPSLVSKPNPAEPDRAEPVPTEPKPSEPDQTQPGQAEPQPDSETETKPVNEPVVEPTTEPMGPPAPPIDRPVSPQPVQPEPPQPTQQPTAPGEPAELSDRQADLARREALDYDTDTNRPLASEGLEIKTVRPDWPVIVRQSFRPRNPVVLIHFGANGKVKRVDFLRETNGAKGTGIRAVDGPIIDAVYRWTAKGARIESLDRTDPNAEFVVSIRMILSGNRRRP